RGQAAGEDRRRDPAREQGGGRGGVGQQSRDERRADDREQGQLLQRREATEETRAVPIRCRGYAGPADHDRADRGGVPPQRDEQAQPERRTARGSQIIHALKLPQPHRPDPRSGVGRERPLVPVVARSGGPVRVVRMRRIDHSLCIGLRRIGEQTMPRQWAAHTSTCTRYPGSASPATNNMVIAGAWPASQPATTSCSRCLSTSPTRWKVNFTTSSTRRSAANRFWRTFSSATTSCSIGSCGTCPSGWTPTCPESTTQRRHEPTSTWWW